MAYTVGMNATPQRRLRWYQYSLRSLFVLMAVVAAAGSWFAVKRQQVERQRAAVKAIQEFGGVAIFDWDPNDPSAIGGAVPPEPAWLPGLLGDDFFSHVTAVYCGDMTDVGLAHFEVFTQLQELDLAGTQVTDAGLEHLKGLAKLQMLALGGTNVTDAGLEHLKGLTRLQKLLLDETKVTDAGFEHLKGLSQLQVLTLSANAEVTDAGLEHLKGLPQLQLLLLGGTKVTREGVKKLRQALPDCSVFSDFDNLTLVPGSTVETEQGNPGP